MGKRTPRVGRTGSATRIAYFHERQGRRQRRRGVGAGHPTMNLPSHGSVIGSADDLAQLGVRFFAVRPYAYRPRMDEGQLRTDGELDADLDASGQQLLRVGAPRVAQMRRAAAARNAVAHEFGLLTSADVAEFAGATAQNTGSTAHRWKKQRRIFSVRSGAGDLYPGFQFAEGMPVDVVRTVLDCFVGQIEGWAVAFWFVSANGWLDGRRPVDLIGVDDGAVCRAAAFAVAEPQ